MLRAQRCSQSCEELKRAWFVCVQIAVGCLLHLGNEAWPILQGMLEQALSPAHARRALVMGLKASALKVRADSITCLSLLMVKMQP